MAPEYWDDISKALDAHRCAQEEARGREKAQRLAEEQVSRARQQQEESLQRESRAVDSENKQITTATLQQMVDILNAIRQQDPTVNSFPQREVTTEQSAVLITERLWNGIHSRAILCWGKKLGPTPKEQHFLEKYKYKSLLHIGSIPDAILYRDSSRIALEIMFGRTYSKTSSHLVPESIWVHSRTGVLDTVALPDFRHDWRVITAAVARAVYDPAYNVTRYTKGHGYWEDRPPSYPYIGPQNNP